MSMHEFYTNIATQNETSEQMQVLVEVAKAELEQVLAVRSELAWDSWREAK
ncbi:MAG: hypothetical protein KIS88_05345 [Anaerolineales bacterium]|nr:hypothetical protein [Anaerolineales bacterium]